MEEGNAKNSCFGGGCGSGSDCGLDFLFIESWLDGISAGFDFYPNHDDDIGACAHDDDS